MHPRSLAFMSPIVRNGGVSESGTDRFCFGMHVIRVISLPFKPMRFVVEKKSKTYFGTLWVVEKLEPVQVFTGKLAQDSYSHSTLRYMRRHVDTMQH